MDISHFSGGNKKGVGKDIRLEVYFIEKVFRKGIFFIGGDDDKLEFVEGCESFFLSKDLPFESVEQLIRRVILNS